MNLRRYFLALLIVLFLYSPVGAQETAENGQFYLDLSGSAVFPYEPNGRPDSGGAGASFKAGAGFTAAFGYAFTEGFSTEMEWGYQKAGIGAPTENLSQDLALGGFAGSEGFELPAITIEIDGELKTQSLMGNVYYRYPRWSVSPYAGFGLGAFFHDGALTSTVTVADDLIGDIISGFGNGFPAVPLRTTVGYQDSRFAYQIMGGLSARVSQRVEFHLGYRFRSSRGEPIDADQIEAGLRFQF